MYKYSNPGNIWRPLLAAVLLATGWGVQAQTPEEQGLEIAIAADQRDAGW